MEQASTIKTWLPALVCMVCQGLGMGLIGVYGFFVEPLAGEFNVSRTAINSGPIFLLIMPAFLGPLVGKLADRVSIRQLLLLGVVVSMSSLYAMTYMDSFLYVVVFFMMFCMGMVFYGPISVNAFLVKQYRSRAGRALAIAAMGVSLSTAVLPICVAWLMEVYSWRDSLAILAIGLLVVLVSSIIFGLKDGEKPPLSSTHAGEDESQGSGDANFLRSQAFWLIGLVVAIAFSSSLVIAICYPPHFISLGFSELEAGLFLTAGGMAGLCGKFCVAALIDRFQSQLKYFAMILLLLQVLGFSGLLLSESYYAAMLSVSLAGLGGGAFIPMHPILNNGYFDAKIIGRVNGAQVPMMLPLGLIGLPLSGYAFDQTGSYQWVIATVIVMFVFATILLCKLPKCKLPERI